ncbi:hypothetical protein Tco_0743822 [Tanacetum coccineum]
MPNIRSISNKDLFHLNSSLYLFALFSFLDSSDHGVGISNSLLESDKHTSLGEHSVSLLAMGRCYVIEDVGEDDDFTRALWLSLVEYINVDGGIMTGYLGDVKRFLKNGKVEKVVAIIKSCTLNALGDFTVTMMVVSDISVCGGGGVDGLIVRKTFNRITFAHRNSHRIPATALCGNHLDPPSGNIRLRQKASSIQERVELIEKSPGAFRVQAHRSDMLGRRTSEV